MPDIAIGNPIHTPDGNELFPAGGVVHEDALMAALEQHVPAPAQTASLSQFGTFQADTLGFLRSDPYRQIFSDPQRLDFVMQEMEKITLPVGLIETLDLFKHRDLYTYRHFCMVLALSTLTAKELAVEEMAPFRLAATGPTHDVGKICVPPSILRKQTPLTHEERRILNEHSVAGYVLLRYFSRGAATLGAKVALEHHERRDRSGFPRGIELDNPVVEIIAVCDIYDALISPRPYRTSPYDNRTALEELCKMAEGGKIGWDIVRALIALNRSNQPRHEDVHISSEKRGTPPGENNYGIFSD
jgi:HD-GYP domain-containing protein (c-di-GMP phosphodiesterase class II)